MPNLKHFAQELKTRYLESFANKRAYIRMDRPIISITFDDAPRTAMTNGVPILNRFDIKATFYVAMGLSASSAEGDRKDEAEEKTFLTSTDILELRRCGHDIGCHTYSHYILDRGTADSMALDAQRNVRKLCALLDASSIDHFSYPFGQVNFIAKKVLAENYRTMRSSRPGINQGSTDMYLLRAISIYDSTFNKEKIRQVIQKAERSGGWLIFYTHGVTDNPDAHSCTPEQLECLIKQCKLSSAEILTVSEAYTNIVSNR